MNDFFEKDGYILRLAKKEDALKRARNIAANRNTEVIEHTKTTN